MPAMPRLHALALAVKAARARDRWRTSDNLAAGATALIAAVPGAETRLRVTTWVLTDTAMIARCVDIMPSSSLDAVGSRRRDRRYAVTRLDLQP